MKPARIRALRKSIFDLIESAMAHDCSGIAVDYLLEAKELVDVLCLEFDDEEPEELDFG